MLNVFKLKRVAATLLTAFLPVLTFYILLLYYGYWIAIGGFLAIAFLMIFLAGILLKNPFTLMLEGKGLLVFNIDSTGIIRPFVVGIDQPYVFGFLGKQKVHDVYDRDAVMQLAPPDKNGKFMHKDGKIHIDLTEDQFNKSRYGMYQYPVLIYNAQVKSLLTKDFLSEQEKQSFAEHGVLYLNRKLEELSSIVRDFGRYVVELTKPQSEWYKNKWLWLILVVFGIIMLLLFARPIIDVVMNTAGNVAGSTSSAASSAPVTPR